MSNAHIEAVTPSSRPYMSREMAKALRPTEWIAAARRAVGGSRQVYRNTPVLIVDGDAVTVTGESYYFTTPSGKTRVQYPGAYKWRTVYHASTLCVEIGRDWRPSATRRDIALSR
jgi:hypothetical protein